MRVLDIGSGAGLPGIPLAILRPAIRIDLVDATQKKCEFLEAAVVAAAVTDAQVHWCRIERPTAELRARGPFDVSLARAVGEPARLGRAVRPLLSTDGALWTYVAPGTAGSLPWPTTGAPSTALLRWSAPV
jgi:16S rRNA (guanine527-N7)-methyltransferase